MAIIINNDKKWDGISNNQREHTVPEFLIIAKTYILFLSKNPWASASFLHLFFSLFFATTGGIQQHLHSSTIYPLFFIGLKPTLTC
jgi:hypothetical protein